MRRKLFILLLLTFGALLPSLFAEETGLEILTWENCVEEAGKNNPDLSASQHNLEKNRHQKNAAVSPFLPSISGTLSYSHSNSSILGVVPPVEAPSTASNQYAVGLTATQNLFNGFQDVAKRSQAHAKWEGASASLRNQKAKLHSDLKGAFAQALYQQEILELLKQVELRRRDNAELVALRFEGGRENKGSAMRTQAQLAQANFEVGQAERNFRVAQRQLARLLGRNHLVEFRLKGSLNPKKPASSPPNFRELARMVPSREESEAGLREAQAGIQKARGEFFPSLSVSASVSRLRVDSPPDSNRWSVGATVTIPIFNGGLNVFNFQTARAEELRAEEALRSSELQAEYKLEQGFFDLENAIASAAAQEQTLKAAELRGEIARGQYESGLLDYNQWDIIENELIREQQALLKQRRDALIAEAAWELAMGKGDIP